MTEGRRAFLRRVSGIERGADCARYEPLLSALADGEASAEDLAVLRPHMRTCLSCRAALREFRAMPDRVASVVPPAALAVADGAGPLRSLAESALAAAQQKLESALGAAQGKSAAMGERLHAAAELATGQKLAAVAASAAALAGGGTAIDQFGNNHAPARAAQIQERPREPVKDEIPVEAPPPPGDAVQPAEPAPPPQPSPAAEPAPPPPAPPPPDPANEFAPAPAAPAPASTTAPVPPEPTGGSFTPAGGSVGGSGGGGSGEFAP